MLLGSCYSVRRWWLLFGVADRMFEGGCYGVSRLLDSRCCYGACMEVTTVFGVVRKW